MARSAVNFTLPKTLDSLRKALGRRPRSRKNAGSGDATHQAADALLRTQYGLTEEGYRDYGVREGALPAHLADTESFKVDEGALYAELEGCGTHNIASIVQMRPETLLDALPEGPCGDVLKDIALLPEGQPLGMVNRKVAVEVISQLRQYATMSPGRIEARGMLLDGKRGAGKSYVLNHVVMWARRNGWMVVAEPTPSKYAREVGNIKRSNAGVYIQVRAVVPESTAVQSEFAVKFLESLMLANAEKLESIPVKLQHYGKIALDGNHVDYTKRMFNRVIEKAVGEELEIFAEEGGSDVRRAWCGKRGAGIRTREGEAQAVALLPPAVQDTSAQVGGGAAGMTWPQRRASGAGDACANRKVRRRKRDLRQPGGVRGVRPAEAPDGLPPAGGSRRRRVQRVLPGLGVPLDQVRGHTVQRLDPQLPPGDAAALQPVRRGAVPERAEAGRDVVDADQEAGVPAGPVGHHVGRRGAVYIRRRPHEVRTVRAFTPKEYANLVHHLRRTQTLFNFPADKTMYFYMLTGTRGDKMRHKYYRGERVREPEAAGEALLVLGKLKHEELVLQGVLGSRPLRGVGVQDVLDELREGAVLWLDQLLRAVRPTDEQLTITFLQYATRSSEESEYAPSGLHKLRRRPRGRTS
ncbi:ribosomal death-associated protein 3 [Babesia caballi]|uniref:Small ribosomal subunit protein mS29 n=1 Tax=Babesia caballi TaxID=5871 RepID=A0AAV4M1C0_BABCB|nr:ribosomal death-associated protein 3 [Babesia caballi]